MPSILLKPVDNDRLDDIFCKISTKWCARKNYSHATLGLHAIGLCLPPPTTIIIIIITIYLKNVHFFHAQLGSDVFPDMRLLHISLNTTYSECKPSSSISFFTHSLQVFLPLPAHLTPATTTFLQADTQSSPLLRSTCPNHLNLLRLITSAMLSTSKEMYVCLRRVDGVL